MGLYDIPNVYGGSKYNKGPHLNLSHFENCSGRGSVCEDTGKVLAQVVLRRDRGFVFKDIKLVQPRSSKCP